MVGSRDFFVVGSICKFGRNEFIGEPGKICLNFSFFVGAREKQIVRETDMSRDEWDILR